MVYFPFHFHFAEFAEKTLKLVSKNNLDERLKSKLSGFIAAVILDNRFWRDGKFMEARELTKKEKLLLKNTIGLAKEAVRLHPTDVFSILFFRASSVLRVILMNLFIKVFMP